MKTIQRIAGILMLALAIVFVLRIPKNLRAGGEKMAAHIVADCVFASALGLGAFALLKQPSKPS
jgi:hypothetical protein